MEHIGLEVHNEIKKFTNLLTRYTRNNYLQIGTEKISRSQGLILKYISNQHECGEMVYQRDIEKQFAIRRSTATESLKRLESQSLIIRIPDKNDGRLKQIQLTEKANNIKQKAEVGMLELYSVIAKDLTEEELITIKNVVVKMQNNLKEHALKNEKNIKKS